MDIAIGTFQADKEAAFTPTLGEVNPIDIVSLKRRKTDDKIVTDLEKAVARDGGYLHPPAVRDEGDGRFQLIHGHHRLEAWKRCRGEQTPIPANIYPPHTPDALITVFEIEENLLRRHLTAAERERQTILLAAALRKLDEERSLAPVSASGETGNPVPRLASPAGGRGNKGVAQRVAEKAGITKRAVRKRLKAASAAIGEKIDLDRDTPEELERKADKRQRAEPRVVRLKRRNPAPHVDDPTPADCYAGKIDSQIEAWLKAFDTFGKTYQFRLAYLVCIRLGLDPFRMAPPAVFGLAEEEHELDEKAPAAVARATDDAPVAQAEPGDDGPDLGAENLQVADDDGSEDTADDAFEAADQENLSAEDLEDAVDVVPEAANQPSSANLHAEQLQDAGVDGSEAADQEPDGAMKCAYCNIEFESGDQLEVFKGRVYHGFCVEDGKRLAKAKQGKQIAIAA